MKEWHPLNGQNIYGEKAKLKNESEISDKF